MMKCTWIAVALAALVAGLYWWNRDDDDDEIEGFVTTGDGQVFPMPGETGRTPPPRPFSFNNTSIMKFL